MAEQHADNAEHASHDAAKRRERGLEPFDLGCNAAEIRAAADLVDRDVDISDGL